MWMDLPFDFDFDKLAAIRAALLEARNALQADEAQARETINRLTRSLLELLGESFLPQLRQACEELLAADDKSYLNSLDHLLDLSSKQIDKIRVEAAPLLIVTGDPEAFELFVERVRGRGQEVFVADSIAAAKKKVQSFRPSLILVDLALPDGDGRNLLFDLREPDAAMFIPVLVVAVDDPLYLRKECIALGASDVVRKPFDVESLLRKVDDLVVRTEWLHNPAMYDAETGLPNARKAHEIFAALCKRTDVRREPLVIVLLQIDDFDAYLEELGKQGQREILLAIIRVLRKSLRGINRLVRWDTNLFIAFIPNVDLPAACATMHYARERLSEERFNRPDGTDFTVSFSGSVQRCERDSDFGAIVEKGTSLLAKALKNSRSCITSEDPDAPPFRHRILLAEDDTMIAKLVTYRLERQGLNVNHVDNGRAAIQEASNTRFDLALLDVRMGDVDGFEVLKTLRSMPNYQRIPILMLTSVGNENDIVRAFELGADDYILKPFSPWELGARVLRQLARET